MCGIAGIISFRHSPQLKILKSMLNKISYRGPDASGFYRDDKICMGMVRLSIIDLTTGNQPIFNENKTLSIVFNGEIYNYLELRDILIKKGHRFYSRSDTEVLIHLYEEEGYAMVKKLNGMFAIAIWDKIKNELYIARDQLGIKPLYYWQDNKTFIFGSELKTILCHPSVNKKIDFSSLNCFLSLGYIAGKQSIYENIHKLEPGHYAVISEKGIREKAYWQIKSFPENNYNLENILFDAVNRQSISDVPLGVLLSGGIDSSLVAYYLSKTQKKQLQTFSINFDDKSFAEGNYAKIVARQIKSGHHVEYFDAEDVLSLFPLITSKLDEPLADPSLFPTYKISKLARKFVKVVLSGDGGDELFAGYPTYQGHLLTGYFKILPKSVCNLFSIFLKTIPITYINLPPTEVIRIFLEGLHIPDNQRHLKWMELLFGGADIFLLPKHRNNLWKERIINKSNYSNIDPVKSAQVTDLTTYLPDDLLVKSDRSSMYNSLEMRVPLLDIELVKYAMSVNYHKNIDLFKTKKQLRTIARKYFPRQIIYRKKKGFGIPLSKWMTEELVPLVKRELSCPMLNNFLDMDKVNKYFEDHICRKANNSRKIWPVVMFSAWLKNWN